MNATRIVSIVIRSSSPGENNRGEARYLRAPRALRFPDEAVVPEGIRHLKLRILLFRILELSHSECAIIGSDQFVYFDASDPSRSLAPDVFVRLGGPMTSFVSWKTWERGTPELAVEIVSDSDAPEPRWEEKLARYHAVGVQELVRFDPDAPAGTRLRIWDRVEGDLVERAVDGDAAQCNGLGLWWVGCPALGREATLRLSRSADGSDLLPLPEEAEAQARQAESQARQAEARAREAAERATKAAERATKAAEQRIAELEAELRRRPGG
mgnify:CR=1 FL=1